MKEFERTCEEWGLSLYVFLPKWPDCNDVIERGNQTFREKFYNRSNLLVNNITERNPELEKVMWKYNNYRSHFRLKGITPMEYFLS